MGAIIPVPSGRVSESLVRQRLLLQFADSQSGLLRLETQIGSGQRLILPSDDAPAAVRAVSLQQLLARKNQIATNLTTSQSFLGASDNALSEVAGLLVETRGTAQSVVGTVATDAQRTAAASQVHTALLQLIDTGNQQFRGRYLFAGSKSDTRPFEAIGQSVAYHGNENELSSFADIDLLYPTNADGGSVFGAISAELQGSVNLNPVVKEETKLGDLHGGNGVHLGKIAISDGTVTSIVDLESAETIDDIIELIEHNAPSGRVVTVSLTPKGINVELDATGGGNLTINEVAGGTTAAELGILHPAGTGTGPIVGEDLDPRVKLSTRLEDLLGTRATATIISSGTNNDLIIEARQNGEEFNDVQVSFQNNILLPPGQETVTYNASAKTLVFQINAGFSTAEDVANALNNDPTNGALFRARVSTHDLGAPADPNSFRIDVGITGTLSGGGGAPLDQQSGLQIRSGSTTVTVDTSDLETVEQFLNEINNAGAGVLAEINSSGNGINLRSRTSGVDFSVGENGGLTATQLGLRSFIRETRLDQLNHGLGVHPMAGADFIIRRKDGVQLQIDISSAQTIGDVIDLVNNHPANQVPTYNVQARLATVGNGIELFTDSTATVAPFAVFNAGAGKVGEELGLIPTGAPNSLAAVVGTDGETIIGRDVNPLEVDSAFTALVRLEQALIASDDLAIGRALDVLERSLERLNLARAELGARQQGLDTIQAGLSTEVTSIKDSLSRELDTDLPQAVSDLAGRQAAFQAALQTASAISKLTLLDFL